MFRRFLTCMMAVVCCSAVMAEESEVLKDSLTLGELVVKGQSVKTKLTGNSMITRIPGTALAQSGTAREMLAKVPGMTERNDELEVIGKGKPVFYINGRKLQDMDELKRLRSEEILSVEVITNPGAQYDASFNSVVKIKTLRRQGDGFGYDLMANNNSDLVYGYADPNATVNLRYRHNSLDFFGMANYWKWDNVNDSRPYQHSYMKQDNRLLCIEQDTHLRHDWNGQGLNYNLGFNWQINKDHSIGMRVERHDKIKSGVQAWISTDIMRYYLDNPSEKVTSHDSSEQNDKQHQPYNMDGNAYYNGQIGKLNIDFNFDFFTNKTTEENHIEKSGSQNQTMEQEQDVKASMLADKLVLSYPVWKGNVQVGTEMSFVTRENGYSIKGYQLPSTQSKVNEDNVAGFVQYDCSIPKWGNFSAGLRYEHVGFDYTDILYPSKSMSRYTDEFFPTFSWSRQFGAFQASLAYSTKTIRPNYSMLDEGIIYINDYSLQQGNPQLKNATMKEVSANVRWKWLNLFMAYERRDDTHSQWSYIYNDKGVILIKNINLENPVRNFAAFLNASPTFGCYSPYVSVGCQQFFYTQTLADPREATEQREVDYSKPVAFVDFNNTLRFKHGWRLEANMNFMSKGDIMNFHMRSCTYNLSFVVQKCFLKNDALTIRAAVRDVLQRSRQDIEMDCGYYTLYQHTYSSNHRLDVSVRYTFNATKSKYKGTGAGKAAMERMNDN